MILTQMKGYNKLEKRLKHLKGIVGKSIDDVFSKQSEKQYQAIVANASRTDHTLSDLKTVDHPFAKRHGSIQGSVLGGDWSKKPFMIHSRKGNVASSIRYTIKRNNNSRQAIFHYRYSAPYVKYVVKGTRVMFGRNVILETLKMNEKGIFKKYKKDFLFSINRRFRNLKSI